MTYVREIMKKGIVAARADDSIQKICKLLSGKKISNIPIINKKNELVGIVSEQDIIRTMERRGFKKKKARHVMTKKVLSIKEGDSLEYVSKIFVEQPYRRLPVTRNKKIVGVVTREDIITSFTSDYY